jgi:hypothetical protein
MLYAAACSVQAAFFMSHGSAMFVVPYPMYCLLKTYLWNIDISSLIDI